MIESRNDVIRLLAAVVATAVGTAFAAVGFATESTLALTWFGAAVLVWVGAAATAGPLPWRPRRGWSAQAVTAPLVLGVLLGLLLAVGLWVLSSVGMAESVAAIMAPWGRLDIVWSCAAVIALATGEELALRHGLFTLLPKPARILGTMALSAIMWVVIGNEVMALGAVVLGLACARQRWVTGSILPPLLTHGTAVAMLCVLAPMLVG